MALGLLLSGCGGSSNKTAATGGSDSSSTSSGPPATVTSSHPAKPPPAAPAVAECRVLTYRDISVFFNATNPVPCTQAHTSYTFAIEQLPSQVAFNGVQIQNDSVQAAAANKCRNAFTKFIGGDAEAQALARLSVTYFLPRQAGFDLGARWVRCDVVALKGAKSLADLPSKIQGFLDSPAALTTYGVCSKADPGSSPLVMCSEPHAYRALAAFRLGGKSAPYPGQTVTANVGTQRCKPLVAKKLGVSGGFTYSWTYPSPTDWSQGQRFGYCWNQTTS